MTSLKSIYGLTSSRWQIVAWGPLVGGMLLSTPLFTGAAQCGFVAGGTAAGSVSANQVLEKRISGITGNIAPIDKIPIGELQVASFGLG